MSTEALTESVKTRISPSQRELLDREAERRGLKGADIVREALRDYFARRQPGHSAEPNGSEVAA